jgi:competence protein ComEC
MVFVGVPGPVNAKSAYSDQKEEVVYITKTGKKYHRAGCRYLKHSHLKVSKEETIAKPLCSTSSH